jgi:hypothetical protein
MSKVADVADVSVAAKLLAAPFAVLRGKTRACSETRSFVAFCAKTGLSGDALTAKIAGSRRYKNWAAGKVEGIDPDDVQSIIEAILEIIAAIGASKN